MLKEVIWVIYSMGGLIGLITRNRDMQIPDPGKVAFDAGRYADFMIDEYRNRYDSGWKGK
jgi:hypothetical protein